MFEDAVTMVGEDELTHAVVGGVAVCSQRATVRWHRVASEGETLTCRECRSRLDAVSPRPVEEGASLADIMVGPTLYEALGELVATITHGDPADVPEKVEVANAALKMFEGHVSVPEQTFRGMLHRLNAYDAGLVIRLCRAKPSEDDLRNPTFVAGYRA